MATGKKSFVAYADWKDTFDALPDDVAGQLIKHIFAYVNDENPKADFIVTAVFANIKNTLKRDLDKWERQLEQRSLAGKASAEARATKSNDRSNSLNETERNPTDSVSVNCNLLDGTVSANVILKEKEKSLLSEINISDLEINEVQYFEIALAYRNLFIKNLKEKNAPAGNQEKATYKNYVTPIRLMMSNDGVTKEQLTKVYKYLGSVEGEFWKSNILSTSKLREKFQQLLLKSQENGKPTHTTTTKQQSFRNTFQHLANQHGQAEVSDTEREFSEDTECTIIERSR